MIGVDVLYAGESADPQADAALADSAAAGGNVVTAAAATFGSSLRVEDGGFYMDSRSALAWDAPFDALALDEPFTGLDRENRDLALACIRETAGDRPVLLVTHDAADAAGSPVVTL